MSGGFAIRTVLPQEHAALGELTVAAYEAVGETDTPYFEELRDVSSRAAAASVLVAVDDLTGALLGGITYVSGSGRYAEGDFGDAATFRMLAVSPVARGRGVGRALVGAVIAMARAEGRPAIGIFTRPFMTVAQGLYTSLGFERVPATDWEFAPGERLIAYRLALHPD